MSWLSLVFIPHIAILLWSAIAQARIVHVGVAGWPFPIGWLAIPIARLRRKKLVIVIESAFWRLSPDRPVSKIARLAAHLWEQINRRAVAACELRFFTTDAYREELDCDHHGVSHVIPAIWIDEAQLISEQQLAAIAPQRRRLLFAGRLTAEKGLRHLIAAVERSGVPVDVVGDGSLRDLLRDASLRNPALIKLIPPVPYGKSFTALIDDYATIVVPTLTDEQPRVIFDAFARGIPVIASATSGNKQIVDDGISGFLFQPGDISALAQLLSEASAEPARLREMGIVARRNMAGRTHAAMHAERAKIIVDYLGDESS